MNDRQNTVVATTVAALVLGTVFLCPWRVAPSGDVRWSPIYQAPLTYTRSYGADGDRRVRMEATGDARVAYGILGLQGIAVLAAGAASYRIAAASDHDGPTPPGH